MTRNHIIFWFLVTALFFAFIWAFQGMLLPFVLGLAVAYLLNPLVNKIGKSGVSRQWATLLILGAFFVIVIGFLALVTPIIIRQGLQLIEDAPGYIDSLMAMISPYTAQLEALLGQGNGIDVQALARDHAGSTANVGKALLGGLSAGGQAITGFISLLVITPLVSYFTIKEWPAITSWVEDLFPRAHKKTIMNLLDQIDKKVSGFVRGQITVAVILAVFYAVALSVAGLKYGFAVGFIAGLLNVIPMLGSVLGLLVAVILAWFQAGEWVFVAIIAGIFLFGQFIEGNFLTPKLVGDSVGMHPIWIFFALLAGGSLFGMLGMFLAVPVAAVAGVLLAFGVHQYKQSKIYKGAPKGKTK